MKSLKKYENFVRKIIFSENSILKFNYFLENQKLRNNFIYSREQNLIPLKYYSSYKILVFL